MILHRCFAWDRRARADAAGGALWFARPFQGEGRHDNPDAYGCLYASGDATSAVVEQLGRFRGQRLTPGMLVRRGRPLALAAIELPNEAEVVDLDQPRVLAANRLRPSLVATRRRELTQPQALELHGRHPGAAALRWWSVFESTWANYTVFDRAGAALRLREVRRLGEGDAAVAEAADLLGISA